MLNAGAMGGLYRIGEWIVRLAYVNILWILFTIIGLIIFGFAPATVAALTVIRKWFNGDTEIPIFNIFFTAYKEEFIKVNILGLILVVMFYILYLDYHLLNTIDGILRSFMYIALLIVSLLFLITILYIFPVYVHYRLKLFAYFKHSFMIGIISPFSTFIMVLGLVVLYFIYHIIPLLVPFFGAGLICAVIMWPANNSFNKIDEQKNQ